MNTRIKKSIHPRLRFPEFQNAPEWEEKSIKSICSNIFSGGTPTTTTKKYYGGNIPFIRSAEIDREETEMFLTEDGLANSAAKLINKGDVLIALYGANSGNIAISKLRGAINQAILCLQSKDSNDFIYQYVSHKKDWIVANFIQGGQGNLSGEVVKSIKLAIPSHAAEQQKIADCLSSIDELITAESKKLNALKTYKKGLMQQLFPVEGETLPKLRFPEFQAAPGWEEKTLKELCSLQAGKFITASEIYEKNQKDLYPCYGGNGLRGFVKSYTHNGTYPLIGRQGALCGNINISEGSFYATEHAVVVTAKKGVNVNWLFYQLVRLNLNQYATGQAQPGLSVAVLDKLYSTIPHSPIEQQKIADCLSSIDELITAENKKLDMLKKYKKGLMQQLFPTMSEL